MIVWLCRCVTVWLCDCVTMWLGKAVLTTEMTFEKVSCQRHSHFIGGLKSRKGYRIQKGCDGLNENRLIYFNAWFPISETLWEGLGGVSFVGGSVFQDGECNRSVASNLRVGQVPPHTGYPSRLL